ncbi:MAG: cupin domain-containing protein [Bryobacteraceae bacterium]
MECTRRNFNWLVPILAIANAKAEGSALPSKFFVYEDLPESPQGNGEQRQFFDGKTDTGLAISLHETELPPGGAPHPAHRHAHDEIILIREGTLQVTIAGQSKNLGAGSVAYMASGDPHGVRNAGKTTARYYVLALGSD